MDTLQQLFQTFNVDMRTRLEILPMYILHSLHGAVFPLLFFLAPEE